MAPSGRNGRVAAGDAGSSPGAPYKYHLLAVNAQNKIFLLRYKITCTGWAHSALRAKLRSGAGAAGNAFSSP
jgi:hypothetical protein